MFRFADPQYLFLLLIIAMCLLLFLNHLRKWKIARSKSSRVMSFLMKNFSLKKSWVRFILSALAASCMVLSLARPQLGIGQTKVKSEGVEVMLLVDVSKSMLAEDIRPSRLDHAKKTLMRFLDLLGGDKVGLIAFAGSSVLMSPLTNDKAALKIFIESLDANSVQNQGTEVGKALLEAKEAFARGGAKGESEEKPSGVSKVVLLISDGEDHDVGAEKATSSLTEAGIRVFTMAFGTAEGGKIPVRDARGRLRGYMKSQGKEVVSKVKGDFLKSLATEGKGSFYHVSFRGDQIVSLKDDLSRLEKAEFDTLVASSYDERFQWVLLVGVMLALIELIIGNRKKISTDWKGRFPI